MNAEITHDVPTTPTTRLINWPQIALGMAGFGVAAYAFIVHNRVAHGEDSGCSYSATVNCERVLASNYGTLLGLPWGIWGMAFFVFVIIMAINALKPDETRAAARWRVAKTQMAIAAIGTLTSIALTYISKVLIGAYCPICLTTHAVTTLLFLVSLRNLLVARRGLQS
jgi:uncharacterized membrane protein